MLSSKTESVNSGRTNTYSVKSGHVRTVEFISIGL